MQPSVRFSSPIPTVAPNVRVDTLRAVLTRYPSPSSNSSASSSISSLEVQVGPSFHSAHPLYLPNIRLPSTVRYPAPCQSNPRAVALSDVLRLTEVRRPPASFGSAVHLIQGVGTACRPCMFERRAGRCSKAILCDFCHLHTRPGAVSHYQPVGPVVQRDLLTVGAMHETNTSQGQLRQTQTYVPTVRAVSSPPLALTSGESQQAARLLQASASATSAASPSLQFII
mmetsp:Transcript_24379/g.44741  ORF Transcript_24379/g.44741 Transcript_24379/m.44741 type:complete len:227 (-) Transcript_24379:68-748(-)